MRIIITVAWAILLSVLTCNLSLKELIIHQTFQFRINAHPDYFHLFALDFNITHSNWFLVKLGHFAGFAILNALLMNLIGKRMLTTMIAISFAVMTEIMQLYFFRDGRVFDMLVDIAGIALAARFYQEIQIGFGILRLERKA